MGVRGLTTYIYNNSNKFFDNHKLQNCDIVIDGYCLATILFYNSITDTAAFGGDYDKYAHATEKFFNELLKCRINPIVIFDGGYEKKKLNTVYIRNKSKVVSIANNGPTSHSRLCFPLMMRQTFRDKLREMNIPHAQSDFEADQEVAALARKLNCPVLSSDSDFFIFDVELIPINKFSLEATMDLDGQFYMGCLIYKVEKFLKHLGGLPKTHLPLLAALLGNDYISSNTFTNFYSQMKISRGKKKGDTHKRIQAIMAWLKLESFDGALKKILLHLKKNQQKTVATKVAKIIRGYSQVSTSLDEYLLKKNCLDSDIEIVSVEYILNEYDTLDVTVDKCDNSEHIYTLSDPNSQNSDSNKDDVLCEPDDGEIVNDVLELKETSKSPINFNNLPIAGRGIPPWLLEYSRQGNIPGSIITLCTLKIYFNNPQIEDYELSHSGAIGLPILSKITGILLGQDEFLYYYRIRKCKYASSKISSIVVCNNEDTPLVTHLNLFSLSERRKFFLTIMESNPNLNETVNCFPEKWHVLIFSLVYWAKNIKEIKFKNYFFHSVSLMIICLRVIEGKIGYFRNKKPFMHRYASKIKKIDTKQKLTDLDSSKSISDLVDCIPLEECLTAFEIFLPYFQIEERLKTNSKLFSRLLIHAFAQFQVCLDMAYTLNSLLITPYDTFPLYKFYNSTFFYNMCCNLKKRSNIIAYIETLFVNCPSIIFLHKRIIEILTDFIDVSDDISTVAKRKKRRKPIKKVVNPIDSQSDNDENNINSYSDEDNTFSILSKLSVS